MAQNLVIGRANKLFLGSCKKIFCYSEKILNFPIKFKNKIIIVDPLVRKEFYNPNISPTKKSLFQILVVGGSQGARIFDNDIKNTFLNISKKYPLKIIHQTREKNVENLKNFYALKNIENSTRFSIFEGADFSKCSKISIFQLLTIASYTVFLRGFSLWQRGIDSTKQMMVYD